MVPIQIIFVMLQNCPLFIKFSVATLSLITFVRTFKIQNCSAVTEVWKTFFYWFIVQYGEVLLCVNIIFLKYKRKTSYRKGRFPTHRCSKLTLIAHTFNTGRVDVVKRQSHFSMYLYRSPIAVIYFQQLQSQQCELSYKAFSFIHFVSMFSE